MDKIKVRDILDLMDFDREGYYTVGIREIDDFSNIIESQIKTSSVMLDLIEDETVIGLDVSKGNLCISVSREELEVHP